MRARILFLGTSLLIGGGSSALAQSTVRLHEPTGEYSVGRRTLMLVDSARQEPGTAEPDDRRQVVINIWYPIRRTPTAAAPYMPHASRYRGVLSDATVDQWARIISPVQIDAAAAVGPFPVLLFSHGWSSRSASSSIWLTEVASHGFVVVGVDHPFLGVVATAAPGATNANDEQFPTQHDAERFYAEDLAFVRRHLDTLNRADAVLKGVMRPEVLFAAGHSSGHGAASAFAALYSGVKALISFDAGVSVHAHERGLTMPLLLVRAEDPSYTDIFVRSPKTHPKGTIYDSAVVRKLAAPMFDLHVLGTGHNAIMDQPALQASARVRTDAEHELIAHYTIAFLKSVLSGTPALAVRNQDRARVRLRKVSLAPKTRGPDRSD